MEEEAPPRGRGPLVPREESLEIRPQDAVDLTAYFDAAEVDLEADLADWHGVRRGLRKR